MNDDWYHKKGMSFDTWSRCSLIGRFWEEEPDRRLRRWILLRQLEVWREACHIGLLPYLITLLFEVATVP